MTLELPERIFLDSCVLKRFAHGDCPEATATLRRRIDEGRSRIIVTIDHIADYGDCEAGNVAMREAYFVDTLQPLWMLPGVGIYQREAFSEYLRLTGREPLGPLFPTKMPWDAALQWVCDCTVLPEIRSQRMKLCRTDYDPTFSGVLRAGFLADGLGVFPSGKERIVSKQEYNSGRASTRERGLSDEQFEQHFRQEWIRRLTVSPAELPRNELIPLAPNVDSSRMPAWMAQILVEKT